MYTLIGRLNNVKNYLRLRDQAGARKDSVTVGRQRSGEQAAEGRCFHA